MLKAGDQNSKFFHYQCKERNRRFTIKEITKYNGEKISDPKQIKIEIKEHFEYIYTSEEHASLEDLFSLSNEIHHLLQDKLGDLTKHMSFEEVCTAIWLFHTEKAHARMGSPSVSTGAVGTL